MYVPSLYEVSYKEDGTIASFVPTKEGVPAKITKEIVMDLDNAPYPEKPVVPFIRATQDRVVRNFLELLEFQRLFPSGRAGRLPDDDLSGEKSEYFPAFSAN
mgnify:CR=1 FL=1